ncbi:MAG TPA: hypothetical protein VF363_10405 [Candidatus Eisenbacteria bacterium]
MHEAIASPLEAWASFYVIVGSSAGALTGLQFVVMTLISETMPVRGRGESISAFGTPNVVHFCAALLVASILSVPWGALQPAGVAVAGCGLLGVAYSVIVVRRALRQREYEPVFEDWLWHTFLPALAYVTLLVAGAALARNVADALFVIGAAALLLVFVGIHNAWDTVTFVTTRRGAEVEEAARDSGPVGSPGPGAPGGGA